MSLQDLHFQIQRYILQNILFLVSVAAFLAFQVIPGDVVRSILGTEATPEREARLREELGLDKPPVERYISWADDVLHGDFGVSYRYSKNMNESDADIGGGILPTAVKFADEHGGQQQQQVPTAKSLRLISLTLVLRRMLIAL